MPIAQAVELILQACLALADAHALGLIHQDIRPSTLFRVRMSNGQLAVKELDFELTQGRGTSTYMAPEQLEHLAVDARVDIWALGIVLFELLTGGKVPFHHPTIRERPTSVRMYRNETPNELEMVIRKCLQRERDKRYANVSELAAALLPFAPGFRPIVERISSVPPPPGTTTVRIPWSSIPPSATSTVPGIAPPIVTIKVDEPEHTERMAIPSIAPSTNSVLPPIVTVPKPFRFRISDDSIKHVLRGAAYAMVGAGVLVGVLAFFYRPTASPSYAATEKPEQFTSVPMPDASPSVEPPADVIPTLFLSGAPTHPPAPIHTPAAPTPVHSVATTAPIPTPVHNVTTTASASAQPGHCNPPWITDAEGHRQYKRECFGSSHN